MATMQPLEARQLRQTCDHSQFDFETTVELEDLGEIVGQERFFIDEDRIESADQLHGLIRRAWDERAALREQMAARRRELCEEVVANVKRLGRLLEARRR